MDDHHARSAEGCCLKHPLIFYSARSLAKYTRSIAIGHRSEEHQKQAQNAISHVSGPVSLIFVSTSRCRTMNHVIISSHRRLGTQKPISACGDMIVDPIATGRYSLAWPLSPGQHKVYIARRRLRLRTTHLKRSAATGHIDRRPLTTLPAN